MDTFIRPPEHACLFYSGVLVGIKRKTVNSDIKRRRYISDLQVVDIKILVNMHVEYAKKFIKSFYIVSFI